MERRGERAGFEDGCASAGLNVCETVVPTDLAFDSEAAVEIAEIGAAAEENVLAVVDDLAGAGMFIGGGASAEIGTLFEQRDAESGVGERAASGESGESAADNGDCCGTLGASGTDELR